jgi:hypothetical protein
MIDTKQKYIILKRYNEVIIFPMVIKHSEFSNREIESAGFCYVYPDKVVCFGESVSLNLKANSNKDSFYATKQIFGWEKAEQFFGDEQKEKEDNEPH